MVFALQSHCCDKALTKIVKKEEFILTHGSRVVVGRLCQQEPSHVVFTAMMHRHEQCPYSTFAFFSVSDSIPLGGTADTKGGSSYLN